MTTRLWWNSGAFSYKLMLQLFIYRCVSWVNSIGSICTSTIGLTGLSMPRVSGIYSLHWFTSSFSVLFEALWLHKPVINPLMVNCSLTGKLLPRHFLIGWPLIYPFRFRDLLPGHFNQWIRDQIFNFCWIWKHFGSTVSRFQLQISNSVRSKNTIELPPATDIAYLLVCFTTCFTTYTVYMKWLQTLMW